MALTWLGLVQETNYLIIGLMQLTLGLFIPNNNGFVLVSRRGGPDTCHLNMSYVAFL